MAAHRTGQLLSRRIRFATLLAIVGCAASVAGSVWNVGQVRTAADTSAVKKPPAVSDTVRIMTWNIRYDNPDDGIHAWPRRRDEVLSFIRAEHPDILCIQEGLRNQVAFLKDGLQRLEMRGVGRDDGKEMGEYSAIFFNTERFNAAGDGTFWLSTTPSIPGKGWDAVLPRIVTWVRLVDSLTRGTLYVFNTHFDHEGIQAREKSAHLLLQQVHGIAGEHPVVVAGDFNSTETDLPYRILTSSGLASPRLEDSMRRSVAPHRGPSATFTGFEPVEPNGGPRIDYIFVSESVIVLNHSTREARGTNGLLSDHLPVVIEISLDNGRF